MIPAHMFAVVQFEPKALDLEANFSTAESYIRSAASQGCAVVVLPEYHLTSWCPQSPNFREACIQSASYLSKYQELARQCDISIVPGTICEPIENSTVSSPDDRKNDQVELANVAYFIAASTGEICGRYQKKNLWHPERPHLTSSGNEPHNAFDTPLLHSDGRPVRAGLLICWDLAFPEAFRALIADGADIIIIPAWWFPNELSEDALRLNPESERIFLESATLTRAYENTAAVVFCNAGGLSSVTMPILGCLERADIGEEKMFMTAVDMNVLAVAELNYKVRQDMRSEGWHYKYTLTQD